MGKAGRNERRRVTAQYLNGIALAVLASGIIGPTFAGILDIQTAGGTVVMSFALHIAARRAVDRIEG